MASARSSRKREHKLNELTASQAVNFLRKGEVSAEDEIQCIGDERIVIDDQQFRLGLLCHPRALPRLACNTAIVPDRPPDRSFSYGDGLPDTGKKRLLQIERGAKSVTKVCGRAGKSQPAFVYYADPIAKLFDVG